MLLLSPRFSLLLLLLAVPLVGAGFKAGDTVEISWSGAWYKGKILSVEGDKLKVSYDGYGSNWDETLGADRLRPVLPLGAVQTGSAVISAATPAMAASAAAAASPIAPPGTLTFPERPPGNAGIEGAFLRVMSWFFNGRMSLDLEGWFFTRDGRVSRSPAQGFSFDEFRKAKTARKTDGVYGIVGNVLTIVWAGGAKPVTMSFEAKDAEGIVLDGIIAVRASAFKPGWRIDAVYEGGASVGGGGSHVANSNSLQLHRDGTFGGGSVGSVSSSSAGSTVSGGAFSSSAGTYAFEPHTLVLTHTDGRVERKTVFPFGEKGGDGAPTQIWREGTMLHRRDQ